MCTSDCGIVDAQVPLCFCVRNCRLRIIPLPVQVFAIGLVCVRFSPRIVVLRCRIVPISLTENWSWITILVSNSNGIAKLENGRQTELTKLIHSVTFRVKDGSSIGASCN